MEQICISDEPKPTLLYQNLSHAGGIIGSHEIWKKDRERLYDGGFAAKEI